VETTSDKTNDVDFGITAVPEGTLLREATDFLRLPPGASVGASTDNKFEGTGETTHEAEMTATVAVRVVRILPGGIMQVEGARRIRVNNETQILVVRGLVRPQDITSGNTVPSTHLAEAQIELYGEGVLSDRQRPGWLTRILDNIWPF
jgi:flagellar L-ring protein precursor FlgH